MYDDQNKIAGKAAEEVAAFKQTMKEEKEAAEEVAAFKQTMKEEKEAAEKAAKRRQIELTLDEALEKTLSHFECRRPENSLENFSSN